MLCVTRQFGLASAVLAAWLLLGGGSVRAGYVAAGGWHDPDRGVVDTLTLAAVLKDHESQAAPSAECTNPPCPEETNRESADHALALAKLLHTAWHFSDSGGAGGMAGSSSITGPSSQPVGDVPNADVPPLMVVSLLPPQSGDAQPFSVASFLFRPPRPATHC